MSGAASGSLTPSLWDVEDAPAAEFHVRDMNVAVVGTSDVTEFCKRYHYARTGGSMLWRWGLWHGATLLGVVAYNLPTRTTCESVFGPEHFDKVWHMGRLAVAEESPANSESRLIGGSLRAIQQTRPDIWAVLTYAAPDQNHVGYVYQATNAIYTGVTSTRHSVFYTDPDGNRRADYLGGWEVTATRAAEMGWTASPSSPKHRYVYILGNKRERRDRLRLLKLPLLPYPKAKRAS